MLYCTDFISLLTRWRSAEKAGRCASSLFFWGYEWSVSPYINRFLQPDTVIPSAANPQSWNRYSYTENNPINYSDSSGHFKCQNNSYNAAYNGNNCQKAVESLLTLLEEKGGKEGQALVKAFRNADVATVCGARHRGGAECQEVKDQITITIDDGGSIEDGDGGGYTGGSNFSLSTGLFSNASETGSLVHAGQLGHEIVHLTQDDILDRVLGQHSGSLYREIDAYDVQSRIYENMGLASEDNGTVDYAADAASLKGKSPKEILSSAWAKAKGQYDGYPLRSGGSRRFDDWWYLD